MIVLCAWCEKEGKRNVLKEEDGKDGGVSHGICEAHQAKILSEIMPRKKNPRRRRRR
jgi:hypothetical protein